MSRVKQPGLRSREKELASVQAHAVCAAWNDHTPEGSDVELIDDLGDRHRTRTRSVAWVIGGGVPVVMVEGRSGGYLLSRLVRVVALVLLVALAACGDNITAPDARPDPDALVVDAAPDAAPDAAELGACDVVCNDGTPIWTWTCNADGCYCNGGFPDCVAPVDGGVP